MPEEEREKTSNHRCEKEHFWGTVSKFGPICKGLSTVPVSRNTQEDDEGDDGSNNIEECVEEERECPMQPGKGQPQRHVETTRKECVSSQRKGRL